MASAFSTPSAEYQAVYLSVGLAPDGMSRLCRGYMWNKVISKLVHRLIAAHEYFSAYSLSPK